VSTFGDFGSFGGGAVGGHQSPIMPLLKSFDQTATISSLSAGGRDEYGNPTDTYTEVGIWPCRLWQATGREDNQDRDTQQGTYQLILPPDAIINGHSRVEVEGSTFEVVGPPLMRRTPSGASHITATLTVAS